VIDTAIVPIESDVRRVRWLLTEERDPEELPDDQIVPDNADPLPPDPDIKTDPVDDE
jgi:hypothetical protein